MPISLIKIYEERSRHTVMESIITQETLNSSHLNFTYFGPNGKIGRSKTVWDCWHFQLSAWNSTGCTKLPDKGSYKQLDLILHIKSSTMVLKLSFGKLPF